MAKNTVIWDQLDEEADREGAAIRNAPKVEHVGKKISRRRREEDAARTIHSNRAIAKTGVIVISA